MTIKISDDSTNGHVIEELFPTCKVKNPRTDVIEITLDGVIGGIYVTADWWHSPYRGDER